MTSQTSSRDRSRKRSNRDPPLPTKSMTRYLEAVILVVRDQERKYDECLVDRLIELHHSDTKLCEMVLDMIIDWYRDENMIEANHARMFKLQAVNFVLTNTPNLRNKSKVAYELFWDRIPSVIRRDNTSEITLLLRLLVRLLSYKSTFLWIIGKKFTNEQDFSIPDLPHLALHFLGTNKSYHLRKQAHEVLVMLMRKTFMFKISLEDPIVVTMRNLIDESLKSNPNAMYKTIIDCLVSYPCIEITEMYSLKPLMKRCFDEVINNNDNNTSHHNISDLCKCLALAKAPHRLIIEELVKMYNFDAILAFVTNFHETIFDHSTMRYIVIYPILVHCDSEEAQVLTMRLNMILEEKYFVQKFAKDEHVASCLAYMRKSFNSNSHSGIVGHLALQNQRRYLIYFMTVILEYIKCNYRSHGKYYHIVQCCGILYNAKEYLLHKTKTVWLFLLIDEILNIIESYLVDNNDELSDNDRAILLQLIPLVASSHRRTTIFRSSKFTARVHSNYKRYLRIARKFTNLDVLNEFAILFSVNGFRFDVNDEDSRSYIELVYGYMYPLAKQSAFHDLFGSVVSLFCHMDFNGPKEILSEFELDKHRTIPQILTAILNEPSTDEVTIEAVLESIKEAYQSHPISHPLLYEPSSNYLHSILKSYKYTGDDLKNLIEAICLALLRDLSIDTHLPIVKLIFDLTSELIRHLPTGRLTNLMIKTRILDTIYHIHENSSYCLDARREICNRVHLLKHAISTLSMEHLVARIRKESGSDEVRCETAPALVEFILGKGHLSCTLHKLEHDPHQENIIGLDTYVDNVLNQKSSSCGTLECY